MLQTMKYYEWLQYKYTKISPSGSDVNPDEIINVDGAR